MIKKKLKLFKIMLAATMTSLLMMTFSCSAASEELKSLEKEEVQQTNTAAVSNIDLNVARLKAETRLLDVSEFKEEWDGAEIGDYYVWFNPVTGDDTPAYVEFKVTKNGADAGYIMVSLTELDFEIPEYSTSGKATYEIMQEKAETTEIKGVRFDPFNYMAETQAVTRGAARRVFLGDLEYLNETEISRSVNTDYEEFLASYIESKAKLGGIGGSAEELKHFYEWKAEENNDVSRGKVNPPFPKSKYTYISDVKYLPTYNQYKKDGGFSASGCSPTAAAIVLAYWYRKHGKTKLFDSRPSLTNAGRSRNEEKVIERLRTLMKTSYDGGTYPFNCWNGLVQYLGEKGCPAWVTRWYWVDHNSDEGEKFWVNTTFDWENIFNEIKANRPAILHFKGRKGHSVVIKDVTLYYDQWKGVVGNVECTVNYGWGEGYAKNSTVLNASSNILYEVVTCNIW